MNTFQILGWILADIRMSKMHYFSYKRSKIVLLPLILVT